MSSESLKDRGFERRFYLWFAIAAFGVLFIGFARSYFLRQMFGFPVIRAMVEVHGFLMTSWFVLFVVQVVLIARRKTSVHRTLGWFGVALVSSILIASTSVIFNMSKRGLTPFPETVGWPGFLLVAMTQVVLFVGMFASAILLRANAGWHKRLMLMATLPLVGAAVSRIPVAWLDSNTLRKSILVNDIFLALCIAVDTVRYKRVHPAFLWGGLVSVAAPLLAIYVGNSKIWTEFASWLVR